MLSLKQSIGFSCFGKVEQLPLNLCCWMGLRLRSESSAERGFKAAAPNRDESELVDKAEELVGRDEVARQCA